jgi:capsular polysaccharide biosynthesis protein
MQRDSTAPAGERNLDLIGTLRVLRQRAPLIAMCVLLSGGAAFALSKSQRKQYTAAAQILFRSTQLDQQAAGLQVVSQTNPQPQTDTNLKLATLPRVAAQTAAELGHGLTRKQVSDAITVSQESDTDLARVSATWTSPTLAAQMANTYAQTVIADRQRADANYYSNALEAVNLEFKALTPTQQRGVEGANLKDRANSLQILTQLQSGEVQLEQAASSPAGPSSPKTLRNTVLGAFVGLLLGVGLAFLLHRTDRRLRDPSDLEEVYRVPLLAIVPESSALRQAQTGDGSMRQLPPAEAEIFGRAKPGDGCRDGGVARLVYRGRPPTSRRREVLRNCRCAWTIRGSARRGHAGQRRPDRRVRDSQGSEPGGRCARCRRRPSSEPSAGD